MGAFHATCIFLRVICKRLADGVLKGLIAESGLLGKDQASQMLKGKDYNNSIRVYLYIAEANKTMKLEAFENLIVGLLKGINTKFTGRIRKIVKFKT